MEFVDRKGEYTRLKEALNMERPSILFLFLKTAPADKNNTLLAELDGKIMLPEDIIGLS